MKHQGERAASSQRPFWKLILERHQYRGRLMRARVPLVLFRFWSARNSPGTQTLIQSHIVRYPLNLQIQLSWPSSVEVHGSPVTLQQFNAIRDHFQRTPGPPSMQSNQQITSVINSYANVVGQRKHAETALLEHKGERSLSVEPKSLPPKSKDSSGLTVEPKGIQSLQSKPKVETAVRRPSASRSSALKDAHLSGDLGFQATSRVFSNTFVRNKRAGVLAKRHVSGTPRTTIPGLVRRTGQHEIPLLRAISPELRRSLAATPHELLAAKPQSMLFTKAYGDEGGSLGTPLPRLYALPARRNFVSTPANSQDKAPSSQEKASPAPQLSNVPPPPPPLDIGRVSEEVYRHIQRKIRVERERRGL